MSNLCCFMHDEEPVPKTSDPPCWPPLAPPTRTKHDGLNLICGYLKRQSKGGENVKWALRWMAVEPPEDDRPEYMVR